MSQTGLVVSGPQHVLHFVPLTGATFSTLAIDGHTLLDTLSVPQLYNQLRWSCANVRSLSVSFAGCGWRLTGQVLGTFVQFLHSLSQLRRLEISDFVLASPICPPVVPNRPPLTLQKVTITNTHATSLSWLLDCIEPHELTLDSCWFVEEFPDCSLLELYRMQPFEGLVEALLEWDGDHLVIDACPFFDDGCVRRLIQHMEDTQEAVWTYSSVSFDGQSYAMRRRIHELLDIRSRL